mgnify:CR=1 FL=1
MFRGPMLFRWVILVFADILWKATPRRRGRDRVMAFMRRPAEPVITEETEVWACTNGNCRGWMRKAFSLDLKPKCPLCQSDMREEIRLLPEIRL